MAGSGKTSPSEIHKNTGMAKMVIKGFPLKNMTIFSTTYLICLIYDRHHNISPLSHPSPYLSTHLYA
jgi:hypothetical protein